MEPALKTRLIGAFVLIAIAVIVVPMLFPGAPPSGNKEQSLDLNIPQPPDSQMQSRSLSLATGSSAAVAASSGGVQVQPGQDGALATVNIPSHRPQDVHPEDQTVPAASAQPAPAPSDGTAQGTTAAQAAPTSPAASPEQAPPAPQPQTPSAPARAPAKHPSPVSASSGPGTAAHGRYSISLGAYADKSNAQSLLGRVRALGYPVHVSAVSVGGKPAAKVEAGPFGTRAAAEKARLKIKSSLPGVPAALQAGAGDQQGDAPAQALGHKAGGWAVQLAAYSSRTDANTLRDTLRAQGFDGFVDDVRSGGRTLWRVRAGPETSRAAAEQLRSRIRAKMNKSGVVVTVP